MTCLGVIEVKLPPCRLRRFSPCLGFAIRVKRPSTRKPDTLIQNPFPFGSSKNRHISGVVRFCHETGQESNMPKDWPTVQNQGTRRLPGRPRCHLLPEVGAPRGGLHPGRSNIKGAAAETAAPCLLIKPPPIRTDISRRPAACPDRAGVRRHQERGADRPGDQRVVAAERMGAGGVVPILQPRRQPVDPAEPCSSAPPTNNRGLPRFTHCPVSPPALLPGCCQGACRLTMGHGCFASENL